MEVGFAVLHRFAHWGFDGGLEGQPVSIQRVSAAGKVDELASKVPHTVATAGDRFICIGPAGGGYGNLLERDPEQVLEDVLDGLISRNSAARDYAVIISEGGVLDTDATAAERLARS